MVQLSCLYYWVKQARSQALMSKIIPLKSEQKTLRIHLNHYHCRKNSTKYSNEITAIGNCQAVDK